MSSQVEFIKDGIERIRNPSIKTLDEYISNNTPAILQGVIDEWPASKNWNLEILKNKIGDQLISVMSSKKGIFGLTPESGYKEEVTMTFNEYAEYLMQTTKDERQLYFAGTSLYDFPNLIEDISIPQYIKHIDKKNLTINLWVSNENKITPLHHDYANNLLAQIRGTKRLFLVSPHQTKFLYPNSVTSPIRHLNQTSISEVDYDKYPKMRQVKAFEFELHEGEVLFLPPGWWHEVISTGFSISINFWWDTLFKQVFRVPFFMALRIWNPEWIDRVCQPLDLIKKYLKSKQVGEN